MPEDLKPQEKISLPFQISGTGYYLPEHEVANEEYEKEYGISGQWIKRVTGVETRRVCAPDEACSDMAIAAAQQAIKSAQLAPSDIDLIILATSGADFISPPTSSIIQGKLEATNAVTMDISVACMGFVWGVNIAANFIANGIFKNILVVASEPCSRAANTIDKNTFIILGDGAGAVVLSRTDDQTKGIIGSFFKCDGKQFETVGIYTDFRGAYESAKEPIRGGLSRNPTSQEKAARKMFFFDMNGKKVFKFAVPAMNEAINALLEKHHISPEEVKWVFPHQANLRILEAAIKRSPIPSDRFFINVQKYGNTSAASIPIALAEAFTTGKVKAGDVIILVGFGAGLNWGATAIKL